MQQGDPGYNFEVRGFRIERLPDPFGQRMDAARYNVYAPGGGTIAADLRWADVETLIATRIVKIRPSPPDRSAG